MFLLNADSYCDNMKFIFSNYIQTIKKKIHIYLPNVSIDAEPVILPIPILLPELFKLLSLSLLEAVKMTRKKKRIMSATDASQLLMNEDATG